MNVCKFCDSLIVFEVNDHKGFCSRECLRNFCWDNLVPLDFMSDYMKKYSENGYKPQRRFHYIEVREYYDSETDNFIDSEESGPYEVEEMSKEEELTEKFYRDYESREGESFVKENKYFELLKGE